MNRNIESRISRRLNAALGQALKGRRVGLEKESLRVAQNGFIVQTPHPPGLGAALTHPNITTDYSEALIELVTPPFEQFAQTLQCLDDTHRFVYSQLQNEILWAGSMPCVVAGDASIPIAQYGLSNAGQMKTVYRRGLGHRYGRMMQVIAGVHYNYSFANAFWNLYQAQLGDRTDAQSFRSESYLAMVRNLQRYGWLVPYLFGASPAVCGSFLGSKTTPLKKLFEHSYYGPFATSLRMGDIGYQNNQAGEVGIRVDYNCLQGYIDSLDTATGTPCPQYEKIGLVVDGAWQQLSLNRLQIENEHYSSVRPKQILGTMEKPTIALAKRGVAYIELRSLDVNPYEPLGISDEQMHFLEAFLLFSLLLPSPPLDSKEQDAINDNLNAVAYRGRDPQLRLKKAGRNIPLRDWAEEILDQIAPGCTFLDENSPLSAYSTALQKQYDKISDPDRTPSARMLSEMIENREEAYDFYLRLSLQHQKWFVGRPLEATKQAQFEAEARASIQRRDAMEAQDQQSFEHFLQSYFNQT